LQGLCPATPFIDTGWRRRIGCLIFTGHFRKRALQLVALLRKMTCNLRHLLSLRHPIPNNWICSHAKTIVVFYSRLSSELIFSKTFRIFGFVGHRQSKSWISAQVSSLLNRLLNASLALTLELIQDLDLKSQPVTQFGYRKNDTIKNVHI